MTRLHQDLDALQVADEELARLRRELDEVLARLDEEGGVGEARVRLTAAEERRDHLRRRQRLLEADVQALGERVATEEQRLYGGTVKLPKELESIQQEVAALRRQRGRVEDELLEVMNSLEEAEPACIEAAEELASLEAAHAERVAEIAAERDRLERAIAKDEARRQAAAGAIPREVLGLYEDLARRKGGVAVAHLRGMTCTRCRIAMPEAVRRRVMASDGIMQCPNCERILVTG